MSNPITPVYPFDPTGQLLSNLITDEQHILTAANGVDFYFIVPTFAPYFAESLIITITDTFGNVNTLVNGIDYLNSHWYIAASRQCVKPVYGSISIMNLNLTGVVKLQYQTMGGNWNIDSNSIATILSDTLHNPRITSWDEVTNYPITFPPINHQWDLVDMVGMTDIVTGLNSIESAIMAKVVNNIDTNALSAHISNFNNPHNVTAAQLGVYTSAEVDSMLVIMQQNINTLLQSGVGGGGDATLADEAFFLGQS